MTPGGIIAGIPGGLIKCPCPNVIDCRGAGKTKSLIQAGLSQNGYG